MKRRLAAAQLELVLNDRVGNLRRALLLAKRAIHQEAEFVYFPECMISDYTPQAAQFAEVIPGQTCDVFLELAREADIHFLICIFERDRDHIYNTAVVLGPDGVAGKYRKRKLWLDTDNLEGLDDPQIFEVGDLSNIIQLKDLRLGVLICWDGQYDRIWEDIQAGGAQVIIYPNNRYTIEPRVISERARKLNIPIVGVNRVGRRRIYPPDLERTKKALPQVMVEETNVYYIAVGDSTIADASGNVLAHNSGEETLLIADLDI